MPVELRGMPTARPSPSSPTPHAILHPVLAGDRLLLWAEAVGGGGRVGRAVPGWGAPHPALVDAEALLQRLLPHPPRPLLPGADAPDPAGLSPVMVRLLLPTAGGRPLPSPAAGGAPEARGVLQPWGIRGLQAAVRDARAWLLPFSAAEAGLAPGPEWAVIWRMAAVVRRAVARGAVAPHLGQADGRPAVGWRLVLGRAEQRALETAARTLPPAAVPEATDLIALVGVFARFYAGALVRAAVAGVPALASLRRVPRDRQSPGRYWLASLLAPTARPLYGPVLADPEFARWAADPAGVDVPPRLVLRLDEPRAHAEGDATGHAAGDTAAHPAGDADDGTAGDPASGAGAGQDETWPLAIFLEFPAEPGVLLPPAEVRQDGAALTHLQLALGRAALAVPALAAARLGDRDEVALTAQEAWDLLTVARPRLEAAGARVLVPSWWADAPRPRARLRLEALEGRGLFGADQLVHFDWQVALGDQTLSPEAFERLVARRTPFVRLQSGWAVLPPGAAEALAARWRGEGPSGELTAGAALLKALAVEAEAEAGPDAPELQADERVLGHLRRLAEQPPELPEPEGFAGQLRPYQRRGLAWLATRAELGLGGILADDMGLGKTVQVLALIAHRRATGAARGPTLIVAPTSVVANWAAEAARFVPGFTAVTHQGADRARGAELAATIVAAQIVLTSYPLLLRDADALAEVAWDLCVTHKSVERQIWCPCPVSVATCRALTAADRRGAEMWVTVRPGTASSWTRRRTSRTPRPSSRRRRGGCGRATASR